MLSTMQDRQLTVAPGILDWVAEQTPGGVRPLLGALTALEALARTVPGPLDLPTVERHPSTSSIMPSQPADSRSLRGASALICGSIAFDTIMVFGDRFRNHILPDKIHMLNLSFLVPQMRRENASVEQAFNRTRITVANASREEQVPGVFSSLTGDLSLPRAADAAPHEGGG